MHEEFPNPIDESEKLPQISPEDFNEMMGQIPALKEMLDDRKEELEALKSSESQDLELIAILKVEIEELDEEIRNREELGI